MKGFFQEFKKFISRGNVVDMAVGVAVASAFTAIVTAFTKGFITPLLALISSDAQMSALKWVLREAVYDPADPTKVVTPEVALLWGNFVQAILDFLIIAFTLFIVIKVFAKATAASKELTAGLKNGLTPERIKEEEGKKAAEEAAAKAEAEAKAAAEAAAKAEKEAAEKKAEMDAYAAQIACTEHTAKLLEEIRDLLKNQK